MIGEIIVIVISLVFLIITVNRYKCDGKITDAVGIYGIIFLITAAIICFNFFDTSYKFETPIVSLGRGSEINGNFILGFGSMNSETVYYAYEILGDNQYRMVEMSGDVIIKETNTETPKFIKEVKCFEDGPFFDCKNEVRRIIVPVNTIKKEFKIN